MCGNRVARARARHERKGKDGEKKARDVRHEIGKLNRKYSRTVDKGRQCETGRARQGRAG